METRPKRHFRGLTSEASVEELNIVKPYWVARNFIPPVFREKCQADHTSFRLPLIQSYLKKKESNLVRKQVTRTQANDNQIDFKKHYRNASQSHALKDTFPQHKTSLLANFLSTREYILQNQHQSLYQSKASNQKRVVLPKCRIEEQGSRLSHVSSPQWQSAAQSLRACVDYLPQLKEQRQPLRNKFNTFLTSQSKYTLGDSKYIQSPRNSLALLTPVKDHNMSCKQQGIQSKIQNQKLLKTRTKRADYQLSTQNQLRLDQRQVLLHDQKSDNPTIAISRSPKDSNQIHSIAMQQLNFESQNHVSSQPVRYDKSVLVQSYKQAFNTLQTTIKKKGRTSKVDNTRIMELIAKLKVIKKYASLQDKGVQLEKYVDQLGIQVVQDIGKVIENNQQFKEILKRVNLEWETVELVSRKVTQGRRNGKHFTPLMGLGQSGNDQEVTTGLGNVPKPSGFTKTHNRYHSDNNVDKRPKKGLGNQVKLEQAQHQLEQRYQNGEGLNQESTIRESESTHNDAITLEKSLLGIKGKSKKVAHTVQKSQNSLELASKSPRNPKPKMRKDNVGSHHNTQRTPIANKKNYQQRKKLARQGVRPNSYKPQQSNLISEKHNFRSQRAIYSNKKLFKSRESFLDSIQKIKARLKKDSQSQLSGSIVSSNLTTPPPELIHQIHDDILDDLKGKRAGDSESNRNQHRHKQGQEYQDAIKVNTSKNNGKINRFKINLYDRVDYPYRSSSSEEDSEDILEQNSRQRSQERQLGVNWHNIIKRIPKRRVFKPYKREQSQLKKSKKIRSYLSRHLMETLHRQIYRIMEEQERPQLKELQEQLFANQQQIRQARIKAESVNQEWLSSEQSWVNELDFEIKIVTKNMEHLGGSKIPMMIMRNHDAQNDPIDLYEIACRESKLADKLQEKQRLHSFAHESLYLCEMNQDKGHKVDSYQC